MPTDLLIVTELTPISGDPIDASHNSFAFHSSEAISSGLITACENAVTHFYNSTPTGDTHTVAMWIGDQINRGTSACTIRAYDITGHLSGTPHGSPVDTTSWTLGANWGGASPRNLPEGVAVCLSFHSAYGSDVEFGGGGTRPRARDRGRIYLGPIDPAALSEDATTHRTSISSITRATVSRAATDLVTGAGGFLGPHDAHWCVWSRAKATLLDVVGGWVDDRFDYQRRREDQGLVRTTW